LKVDPPALVRGIFRFLDVDADFEPDLSQLHNVGGVPRSRLLHRLLWSVGGSSRVRQLLPDRVVAAGRSLQERNLSRIHVPDALKAELRALYAEDVLRVQDLIGRDLSAWLPGAR
jgi:hypothetical protein